MPKITHKMSSAYKDTNPVGYKFYVAWHAIKQRCLNKNCPNYKHYGRRGITICDRWLDFDNFYDDMWKTYKAHHKKHGGRNTSIDRVDNNGNYEPKNCRWATPREQMLNQRRPKYFYKNVSYSLKEFARIYKVPTWSLRSTMSHDEISMLLMNTENKLKRAAKKQAFNEILNQFPRGSRDDKIIALRNAGFTLKRISRHFGITGERVRQIAHPNPMKYKSDKYIAKHATL